MVVLTEQLSTERNAAAATYQAASSFSRPNGGELNERVITSDIERIVKK